MKFQTNHIAKFALIATISLAVVGVVGAKAPSTLTNPSSICRNSYSVVENGDPCATPTPVTPTPVTPMPEVPTPDAPISTPAPAPVNYEENVTFNDTDLGVALFKSTDADGNPTMDFFKVETGNTNSTFMFSVTQAEVAPYITNPPAVNTLLASADGVEVYVLTTGEIQVNAGPDAEGKIHVKIFNGIPWTHVYGYTIDPVK